MAEVENIEVENVEPENVEPEVVEPEVVGEYREVFVLGPNPVDNTSNPYKGYDHSANEATVRRNVARGGLGHAGEKVRHGKIERHADGESWTIVYVVDIVANEPAE